MRDRPIRSLEVALDIKSPAARSQVYVVIHSCTGAASSPWSRLGNSGEPTETTETHNGERAGRTRVPRLQRAFCFLTSLQGTYVPVRTVMFYQSTIKKVKAQGSMIHYGILTLQRLRCNQAATAEPFCYSQIAGSMDFTEEVSVLRTIYNSPV